MKEQHLKGLQTSIVGQIGHMHDDVILLLLPESFRVLLCYANYGFCYLNLTGISKFKYERIKERNSGPSSQKDVIVQLSIVSEILVPFCFDDSFLLNFTRFLML